MRQFFKKTILLVALSLCGCVQNEQSSYKTSFSSTTTSVSSLSYNNVKDKTIFWSNIFGIDLDSYYVYIFSKTCNHCASLKQFILEKALERDDIYFVESSDEVVFIKDTSQTIGLTSVEELGIYGYPTLLKIEHKTLVKNLAGVSLIRSELSIE